MALTENGKMGPQHPSAIELVSCVISKPNDLAATRISLQPNMIVNFDLRENLYAPFIAGTITIADSSNLITTYPISGGENIRFKVKTSWQKDPIEWNLVVNNIEARMLPDPKKQLYVLKLVSKEMLKNETVRLRRKFTNFPASIIKDILEKDLGTGKSFAFEEGQDKKVKIPSDSDNRPFDLIAELITQFRPKKSKEVEENQKKFNKKQSDERKITGTAGAFFWETRRGFNLFSADALCDISPEGKFSGGKLLSPPFGPYIENIANIGSTDTGSYQDGRFIIKSIIFPSEVDVLKTLRRGLFSKKIIMFNSATQSYEEFVYSLSDSWKEMAHLGNQDSYDEIDFSPAGEYQTFNTTEETTNAMSYIISDESFFNEPEIANPEDPNVGKNPTPTPDQFKYYAAQSSARFDLLSNQTCILKIPGNPTMCAGDKIQILLQTKGPDPMSNIFQVDTESSGVYLIKELTHNYNLSEGATGFCETTLRLMRDCHGMDTEPSVHGG